MNTRLQIILQLVPVALFVIGLVTCRRWLRRQTNATQAKYRLLGMGQWLIGFAFVGLMIANLSLTSSPKWVAPFCLILVFFLVETERTRLRKQLRG